MFQTVIIAGNLGGDPDMRYFPDGQAVTNFSMATSKKWTDRATGESREATTWFRVSVFGKMAEACNQYLSKGAKVLVEGELKADPQTGAPRLWTRQDGTVGTSFEVNASTVRFLSSRGDSGGYEGGDGYASGGSSSSIEEDDIPF